MNEDYVLVQSLNYDITHRFLNEIFMIPVADLILIYKQAVDRTSLPYFDFDGWDIETLRKQSFQTRNLGKLRQKTFKGYNIGYAIYRVTPTHICCTPIDDSDVEFGYSEIAEILLDFPSYDYPYSTQDVPFSALISAGWRLEETNKYPSIASWLTLVEQKITEREQQALEKYRKCQRLRRMTEMRLDKSSLHCLLA